MRLDILDALTSLDVFAALRSIARDLVISDNDRLIDLTGLTGTDSLGRSLEASENTLLSTLNGLEGLIGPVRRTSISISKNDALVDIGALAALRRLDGPVVISDNAAL